MQDTCLTTSTVIEYYVAQPTVRKARNKNRGSDLIQLLFLFNPLPTNDAYMHHELP